jgi:hypothetical protein
MMNRGRVLFGLFVWLLLPALASAQQGTTEVRGQITDPQGAAMPG